MRKQSDIRSGRRRGFAFTEVLFAVMVLGIGFIMIAAMFPVTIRQTQNTMQDVMGANEGKAAIAYLQTIASDLTFPVTVRPFPTPNPANPSEVFSLQDAPYNIPASATPPPNGYFAVRGNFVNPNNPRIAWLPLYRRGVRLNGTNVVGDPFAQVFVIAIQSRNRTQYFPTPLNDFDPPANAGPKEYATLAPRQVQVSVVYDTSALHGVLTITDPLQRKWAAPGAYVIIASDPNANLPLNIVGQSNGRVYQLGNAIDEPNGVWDLAPGSDMIRKGNNPATPIAGDDNDITTAKPAQAYMVGRGYANPQNAADGYGGPAQDIAVYTGYIQIPPDIHP